MYHLKCLILFLIFSQILGEEKLYDFSPESRSFIINENSDITVGFYQINHQTEFGHCYIEAENYVTDYDIWKVENKTEENLQVFSDSKKGFFTYEEQKECGFAFYTIDGNTPRQWTVIAYDNITRKNYTEKITVTFYYNMALYTTKSVIFSTGAFANFFYNENIELTKCTIIFSNNVTVNLDMDKVTEYNNENAYNGRLKSLGEGKCGYKLITITKSDPTDITLIATDNKNQNYRNTSTIIVTKSNYLENRNIEVHLGNSVNIICGKESDTSANSDQKFCHLYNPQEMLVSHDHMCDYNLAVVTKEDLGIWRCVIGFDYIMESLEFTTELKEKAREIVVATVEEKESSHIIGCQLKNFDTMIISYCKFTSPYGKLYKVVEGGTTNYYNTFKTNLNTGTCSLEISKPLREEDIGTWKCEASTISFGLVGTLIDVEKKSVIPYNKHTVKNVYLGNSFVVDCVVPYFSDYCHILAPNGTQYEPDTNFLISSSLCIFNVKYATVSDNGTWSCSVAQSNGVPDEIITVDISVIEVKLLYADAEAIEDQEVELICNTNGIPMMYCRFVDPSGKTYTLRQSNTTTNKIAYSGRGLEFGDCGLKISNVDSSDNGIWTCHISPGSKTKTSLKSQIKLTVVPTASLTRLAEAVGITAGVLVVIILTAAVVYYKYSHKLKCRRQNVFEPRNSDSNSSSENVVLHMSQGISYNTSTDNVESTTSSRRRSQNRSQAEAL